MAADAFSGRMRDQELRSRLRWWRQRRTQTSSKLAAARRRVAALTERFEEADRMVADLEALLEAPRADSHLS